MFHTQRVSVPNQLLLKVECSSCDASEGQSTGSGHEKIKYTFSFFQGQPNHLHPQNGHPHWQQANRATQMLFKESAPRGRQGGATVMRPHGSRHSCGAIRRRMACSRSSASRRLRPSDRAYQRSSQCRAYSSCATRRQSKSRRRCSAGAVLATQGSARRSASGACAASAASLAQLVGHLCGGAC